MPDKPENLLWIDTLCLPITDKVLDDMKRDSTLAPLASKMKAALRLGERHRVGWSFQATTDGRIINVLPRAKDKDTKLEESEALVMAVELHHIFGHNPNVYKWPVKLAKGCTAYVIRRHGEGEALMTTIILNNRGYFYTSYDPTTQTFYPEVHGLSPKKLDAVYPQMLDELQNMYRAVKEDVKEMRDKDQRENTTDADISE